jgi:hypothetical protein
MKSVRKLARAFDVIRNFDRTQCSPDTRCALDTAEAVLWSAVMAEDRRARPSIYR